MIIFLFNFICIIFFEFSRIMVLDAGRIKEFDTPEKLLDDKGTIFYSLAKEASLVS